MVYMSAHPPMSVVLAQAQLMYRCLVSYIAHSQLLPLEDIRMVMGCHFLHAEPAKIERELKGVRQNLPSPMRDATQVYVGGGRKVVNLRAGESIQLFCPYSGIEEPRAIWLKKEEYGESLEHVQLSSHIRQQNLTLGGVSTSVLSITRLRGDDFGQYICVVHNRAGRDKDSVIIRGELTNII